MGGGAAGLVRAVGLEEAREAAGTGAAARAMEETTRVAVGWESGAVVLVMMSVSTLPLQQLELKTMCLSSQVL